ncbi:tRNA (N6-isopentenyl adenosine(37)-C2)-methylthiotransferase MiaB [bacterium]|nr:tRNA (N6-isopentenyl adenosine(37)-C2)-methylthiotransferase MiaB [bacterium]
METTPSSSQNREGVYISTYGCQMNVNDTDRMESLLEMSGYEVVGTPDQANMIIINSCSIREKAVHKVRSEVGRYRKLRDKNSNLKIGVAGCVAQQEKKKLLKDIPMLDFVFGTDSIDKLPQIVKDLRTQDEKIVSTKFEHQSPYQIETLVKNPGIATFVNITKGCDNFCTFCVVPFTRGRERSRTQAEILADVQRLTQRGVKEVTLVGQNVNSYKSECGADLADLLETLATQTDIQRLRYTTSHPKDFDQKLVDTMQKYREKICDYVHLPVQSGNTDVLARMNRGYSIETYLEKMEMIKKAIPGVSLSTDIIVGFPGETAEQFEDTINLVKKVGYETIFAFKYSARPFTKAARFEEQLTENDKGERLQRLFAVQKEIAAKLAKKYEGQILEVLVEETRDDGKVFGRSTQNKVVHFDGGKDLMGQTVKVRVLKAFPQTFRGELLQ